MAISTPFTQCSTCCGWVRICLLWHTLLLTAPPRPLQNWWLCPCQWVKISSPLSCWPKWQKFVFSAYTTKIIVSKSQLIQFLFYRKKRIRGKRGTSTSMTWCMVPVPRGSTTTFLATLKTGKTHPPDQILFSTSTMDNLLWCTWF